VVENVVDPVSGELKTITRWQDGPLPFAMKHGYLYLMDEYDRCHPAALSVYQAVLEGEPLYIKEAPPEMRLVHPHKNFRMIATGNTNGSGDETGMFNATMMQDAATIERFGIVEKIDYMPEKQEIAVLVAQAGLSEEHAKKLRAFCETIRRGHPTEFSLTIGPRVAINIGKLGIARGSFMAGVALAFANRLPETQRQAALSIAQREFGATI
jgi:cobaltochelatase CobS